MATMIAIVIATIAAASSILQLVLTQRGARKQAREDRTATETAKTTAAEVTGRHEVEKANIDANKHAMETLLQAYNEALAGAFGRVHMLEGSADEDRRKYLQHLEQVQTSLDREREQYARSIEEVHTTVNAMRALMIEAVARAEVAERGQISVRRNVNELRAEVERVSRPGEYSLTNKEKR